MIPDMQHVVEQCKQENPEAWNNMHTGNEHTEDFVRLLVPMLIEEDEQVQRDENVAEPVRRFGLNGKRGNPNDISDDVVNFLCEEDESEGRTPEGKPCVVIDFGIGAGGPNPQVGWNVMTTSPEADGANVDPAEAGSPSQPQPQPPTQSFPYPDESTQVKAFQDRVRDAYNDVGRRFPDNNDPDAYRHFSRYGYSCSHMPEKEAADKHIKELREELGAHPE